MLGIAMLCPQLCVDISGEETMLLAMICIMIKINAVKPVFIPLGWINDSHKKEARLTG